MPVPLIVAIEGYDGSGKSTVAASLVEDLDLLGYSVTTVGRRGHDSTPALAALTELILRTDGGIEHLSPEAEAHVRLARAHQRISLAYASKSEVIVLDRWLGSDLGQLSDGMRDTYTGEYSPLVLLAGLTLHLDGPFDLLWSRVSSRPQEMSPKERLGKEFNRERYERFMSGVEFYVRLGGRVISVDCAMPVDAVTNKVLDLVMSELTARGQPR